ncbi:MAG: hypothetical protein KME04_09930 [Pleurocapsa minor GSE-CHR-MK-17-07R]|jgi:hypothetical protein|nr:hypothetical protein [Pleurocapsa minor GSE-CHR-MK 17-07R]
MKSRGTLILGLFLIAAVAVVGISQLLRSQPPLEITLAVTPLVEDWVRARVTAYNATSPVVNSTRRVNITVQAVDDLQVWGAENTRVGWNTDNHPDGWIAAADFSVAYAASARLPFQTVLPSVGQTHLTWGAFPTFYNDATGNGAALDWTSVADTAASSRSPLAFPHPGRSLNGLAVALSAAAAFGETPDISAASLSNGEFRTWLFAVLNRVPNFNTLGASVAETLASRGQTLGNAALLSEAEWIRNLRGQLAGGSGIRLSEPAYGLLFNFPLAAWSETNVAVPDPEAANRLAAVRAIGAWLTTPDSVSSALAAGIRAGDAEAVAAAFAPYASYGLTQTYTGQTITVSASRTDVVAFIGTINQTIR